MRFTSVLVMAIFSVSCTATTRLPKERYRQNVIYANQTKIGDTLNISLKNNTSSPLRFSFTSTNQNYQVFLSKMGTVYLNQHTDTVIKAIYITDVLPAISFKVHFGDDRIAVQKSPIALPFAFDKTYTVVQGYNGTFSHHDSRSKNAIDFNLKVGDTVCAAADGVVVGVVKDYSKNGATEAWTDFANFITIYHPQANLYTQYVHLSHNGALVKVGDTVKKHQPIGTVGLTGFTTHAHLHFNVLKPVANDWESTAIDFEEGYKGSRLVKGKLVKKPTVPN